MGTVTYRGRFNVSGVDLQSINDAAAEAYKRQMKKPSTVNGNTLTELWKRAEEFLGALGGKYKIPNNTSDDDAMLLYLQALSRFFEAARRKNFPGNPDPGVFGAMVNANHQACIVYLDSILQGLYAFNRITFDSNSRPTYAQNSSETDYFVGYVDSLGNVPV